MSKNARRNKVLPYSVSQNFLTSSKTINRLLKLSSIHGNDYVIEIGAGKGHITKELAKTCRRASVYEIDRGLYEHLQKTLGNIDTLNIINQDFLKASLPKSEPYKVFSNIPFSITSDIIRKLTTASNPPQEAWLIMEKGAAKRFIGKPFDSLTSILIKPFFDTKIEYHFSREEFYPMPSVDIVMLHITRKQQSDIPAAQQKNFTSFMEKSLKYGVTSQLTKRQISTALRLAGLPRIRESGTILYIQWLCLFRCYITQRI